MAPRTFKVGDRVVYFHSFFMRRFDATVTRVTKTRVTVVLDDPLGLISPTDRKRSFTHAQADQALD
jgi:hypothetical protein